MAKYPTTAYKNLHSALCVLMTCSSIVFADSYALHLRKVDNQLQLGTDADAPAYYVQYRTPTTEWQTWTSQSIVPDSQSGVWFRAIFESNPEDPMEWKLADDVDHVLSPASAIETTENQLYWSVVGTFGKDGTFAAAYNKNPDIMMTTASEPPATFHSEPTQNNQAVVTPDAATTKLYWHNPKTGLSGVWNLSIAGGTKAVLGVRESPLLGWDIVAVNDFNDNGLQDILWHNRTTQRLAIWFLHEDGVFDRAVLVRDTSMAGWTFVGTANISDTSPRPEIIWQNNTTGRVALWELNADGTFAQARLIRDQDMGQWRIVGTVDVNNSGRPELIWQNRSTGRAALWFLQNDGTFESAMLIRDQDMGAWRIAAVGDITGDGKPELIWQNVSTGRVGAWELQPDGTFDNAFLVRDISMGNWTLVGAADVNKNQRAELIWFNPSSGTSALWFLQEDGTFDSAQIIRDTNMSAWTLAEISSGTTDLLY
jgi:hypothetical protein